MSDISKFPVLKQAELLPYIIDAQDGNDTARKKVLESNYRLIVRIAREFQSRNLSINDLIQEGFIGLNDAVDRYITDKGVPFAHFAAWWIKMRIIKYIWWYQTTVRLPETQRTGINKLVRISTKFIAEHERVPSMEELLESSGLSERMVNNYLNLFNYGNLKEPENIDDFTDTKSSLRDDAILPDEHTDKQLTAEAIAQCLQLLQPKHQEFLKDYFGIDRPAVSVTEMARRAGTTTENIRQKRARLVGILRERCSETLAPYYAE